MFSFDVGAGSGGGRRAGGRNPMKRWITGLAALLLALSCAGAALAEEGYTVYPGKGKYLEMNMFQVANMGEIYPEDCHKCLGVLKECIA